MPEPRAFSKDSLIATIGHPGVFQPRRMRLTAIAANRSATILDTPRNPCLPIQRVNQSAFQNATATRARLTSSDTNVNTNPTESTRTSSAVSNAGPAINGIPSGTIPNSSLPLWSEGPTLSNSRPARGRSAGSEPGKDGDKSDWIDRHKNRNKGEEKFLDHRGARFLTCALVQGNLGIAVDGKRRTSTR